MPYSYDYLFEPFGVLWVCTYGLIQKLFQKRLGWRMDEDDHDNL